MHDFVTLLPHSTKRPGAHVGQTNGAQADQDLALDSDGLGPGGGLGSLLLAELQVIRCEVQGLSSALLHRSADLEPSWRDGATDAVPPGHGATPLYATFFGSFAIFRAGERL